MTRGSLFIALSFWATPVTGCRRVPLGASGEVVNLIRMGRDCYYETYKVLEKTRRPLVMKMTSLPVLLVLFAVVMTLSSVGFIVFLGSMK